MENQKPEFSMSAYLLPHINPEGMKFGAIAAAIAACDLVAAAVLTGFAPVAAYVLGALFLPLALLAYGTFLFFRDPGRFPPDDPKAVFSLVRGMEEAEGGAVMGGLFSGGNLIVNSAINGGYAQQETN